MTGCFVLIGAQGPRRGAMLDYRGDAAFLRIHEIEVVHSGTIQVLGRARRPRGSASVGVDDLPFQEKQTTIKNLSGFQESIEP